MALVSPTRSAFPCTAARVGCNRDVQPLGREAGGGRADDYSRTPSARIERDATSFVAAMTFCRDARPSSTCMKQLAEYEVVDDQKREPTRDVPEERSNRDVNTRILMTSRMGTHGIADNVGSRVRGNGAEQLDENTRLQKTYRKR